MNLNGAKKRILAKTKVENLPIAQQRLQEMARKVQNSRLCSARNFILAENTQFRSSPLLVAAKRYMPF